MLTGPHWLQQGQEHQQHREHPRRRNLVNNTPIPSKNTYPLPCCAYSVVEHFHWTLGTDLKKAFDLASVLIIKAAEATPRSRVTAAVKVMEMSRLWSD